MLVFENELGGVIDILKGSPHGIVRWFGRSESHRFCSSSGMGFEHEKPDLLFAFEVMKKGAFGCSCVAADLVDGSGGVAFLQKVQLR